MALVRNVICRHSTRIHKPTSYTIPYHTFASLLVPCRCQISYRRQFSCTSRQSCRCSRKTSCSVAIRFGAVHTCHSRPGRRRANTSINGGPKHCPFRAGLQTSLPFSLLHSSYFNIICRYYGQLFKY
jgi:hypothetical protein